MIVTAVFAVFGSTSLHAASMEGMAENINTNACQGKTDPLCFVTPDCPSNQNLLVGVVIPPARPADFNAAQVASVTVLATDVDFTPSLKPSNRGPTRELPTSTIQYCCRNSLHSEEPPLI